MPHPTMSPRARMQAAIDFRPVDVVPLQVHPSSAGLYEHGQKLLDLKPTTKNGTPHCGLVYDPMIVLTVRRFHHPFQGWRYLEAKDAPPDARDLKGVNLPEALKIELAELGLL